jgi:large subunit ribosomal protein L22
MGKRKHLMAQAIKEQKKKIAFASLNNHGVSAKKTKLVVDLVRGMDVAKALGVLKFTPNKSASAIEKLLLSAIANWEVKNPDRDIEDAGLYIKEISVDQKGMLKRIQPAPQGRAHRIRKRSSKINIVLGEKNS